MEIIQSLVLGVIEGITEFLPISSTGHLILVSEILKIEQSDFLKSFEIIIQLGAILSVIALYWRSFLNIEVLKRLVVAFIPTGIIGLALYKIIKTYLLDNEAVVLFALFLGGFALIGFELWYKRKRASQINFGTIKEVLHIEKEDALARISYKKSLWIGFCQSLAIIPGVSRSAATIVGGLLAGLKRKTIVEFSFLLAVPTMVAASGLDIYKNYKSFSIDEFWTLAIGFVVSFIVAFISIKFLLSFIKKHDFIPFGIYRILLAFIFWLIIF
ncbi:MAG: undecaprenyl-diphosphate phosphatase [Candidatus Zambryskibacteria bacterium]|nr:undecaprenyl-diphosphate phosphatase [Candidatus Zambryskibacteria bacterium]